MIVVELEFGDDPRRLDARPAHRETLLELHRQGTLFLAGPWDDDSGALLIFVGTAAEVDQILGADPYYRAPGVTVRSRRSVMPVVGSHPTP